MYVWFIPFRFCWRFVFRSRLPNNNYSLTCIYDLNVVKKALKYRPHCRARKITRKSNQEYRFFFNPRDDKNAIINTSFYILNETKNYLYILYYLYGLSEIISCPSATYMICIAFIMTITVWKYSTEWSTSRAWQFFSDYRRRNVLKTGKLRIES